MFDYEILYRAGVTQAQFADLVGVTRVTVNTWINGHYSPRRQTRARVERALRLLQRAVSDGKLPVDLTYRERRVSTQLRNIAHALNGRGR